jgi:hypothetical protein
LIFSRLESAISLLKTPSALIRRRVVTRYSWLRQDQTLSPMRARDTINATSAMICRMLRSWLFVPLVEAQIRTARARIAAMTKSQVSPSTANQCWRLSKTTSSPRLRRFRA